MIERNLGNIERISRLVLGVGLTIYLLSLPGTMNGIDWFVLGVALMLTLNGIFSRCYLWYILDINTCDSTTGDCSQHSDCRAV